MFKNFIKRPVMAIVVSLIIIFLGLLSIKTLPISQFPEIAPPRVLITLAYPGASAEVLEKPEAGEAQMGQILRADKNGLLVQTKEGCLNIKELQLEGKKRMDTASFLRGYPVDTGLTLGDK